MKKLILILTLIFSIVGFAFADYINDLVVTNKPWIDSRTYADLSSVVAIIGATEKTILIQQNETVTDLDIPSNISLKFAPGGMITYSGHLNIHGTDISAPPGQQIFDATGTGEADFGQGTNLRSTWFEDLHEMFDQTLDNYVTLIIDSGWGAAVDADCQVGNDVTLKWEGPGNRIVINTGFELSNIKSIEAGKYQIFAGSGDFDFTDGTELQLYWFKRLRSVLTWIESEEVILHISGDNNVDFSDTVPSNITLEFDDGSGILTIPAGVTLTLNCPIATSSRQIFNVSGTVAGTPLISAADIIWFGAAADGTTNDIDEIEAAENISNTILFPTNKTVYIGASTWQTTDDYIYVFNNTTIKSGVTTGRCIEIGMRTTFLGHLIVDADNKADTICLRFGPMSGGVVGPSWDNYIESIRPINFTTGGVQFYSDGNSGVYNNYIGRFIKYTSDTDAGFGIEMQTSAGVLPKVNANYIAVAKIFGVDIGLSYNLAAGNTISSFECEENNTWNIKVTNGRGLRILGGNVEHVTATKNLYIADYPDVLSCYFGCNVANIDQITYNYSANRTIFFDHQQYNYAYGRTFSERLDIGPNGDASDDEGVVDYLRVAGGMYAHRLSAGAPYFYFNAKTDGSGFWFQNDTRGLMYLKGDAPGSTQTSMYLLVNDGAATTLKRVYIGAPDSGGVGLRALTVTN